MIYLDIDGRAGNQFFRYAFAKKIQSLRKDELLYVDFNRVNIHKFNDDLSAFFEGEFKIPTEKTYKRNFTAFQRTLILFCRLGFHFIKNKSRLMKLQLALQPYLERHGIAYLELGYYNFKFDKFKGKSIYINGCYEDSRFINPGIRNSLVDERFLRNENEKFYDLIKRNSSVCVSVRRGDFLAPEHASYNLCNEEYFRNAFEIIKNKVKNPTFFIFGDDLEWCRQFFANWNYNFEYENLGCSIGEKILLMSSCKYFIISNSTFSWWVQYLSDFKGKVVVSPAIWNKSEAWNGLIEQDFLKINIM
ncbi:hypothetical protein AXY43_20165 [Clostridium sp. MF28]|uniref:alpha-1,2-fucosyltransferase n=1 Tax=Clostridium TaxID=1485 RepID=UPI000CF97071|nr:MULTISPECIES: alpha-1,2-fucosyltransferase [Clostridium]AVK50117.1 hypothetical protein AXY43_20165 [Clostridium sp. MF28]PSM57647.1 hypothetical protein C4L39_11710 [Clostridium diolis]